MDNESINEQLKLSIRDQDMKNDELPMRNTQEYMQWLRKLKEKVRRSQLQAAVKVNTELLHLYWNMGKEMVEKQKQYAWGDSFIRNLSKDLKQEFPDMKGFSVSNLKYMRQFYLFYKKSQQTADQLTSLFSIPWGHHILLLSRCCNMEEALFYVRKIINHGWSRAVLLNFLDARLYATQGKAITNFSKLLPEIRSDLANETLKDPYVFDFLTLAEGYREKELEDALTANITKFLLELGQGFAYIGRQVPIMAGEKELYADLLFYHLELRCYVVIELKVTEFDPAYIGQLGVYVAAINHQKKKEYDNETLGLLICKTKDSVLAEYALEASSQPIGISEYQLSRLLPEQYQSSLPSIEEIEQSLKNY